MARIVAIDYGKKRIGIAVTDPLQMIASPLITVKTGEFDAFISEYVKKEQVESFVIGYPVQMNHSGAENVKDVKVFIKKIEKTFPDRQIYLVDERLTSRMASKAIIEGGVRKKDRQDKSLVDRISAAIILQSYLDRRAMERNKKE
ncbi:MAG: Holliday junction resolvase RuvX [Bacteroidales bacterium]